MAVEYTPTQATEQARRGKLDFLSAVERAIRSLLEDPAEQDRYNAANQVRDNFEGVPADADAATIQAVIRMTMNANKLVLLPLDTPDQADLGVSTKDVWLFELHRGMGDRHWIVIDRNGAAPAYQEIT
jgi:hypothetical protein